MMKEYIATVDNLNNGKAGRVRTGNMAHKVSSSVRSRTKNAWSGAFGWLENPEDYFYYQNEGFYHVNANRVIRGMNALNETGARVWDKMKARLEKNAHGS